MKTQKIRWMIPVAAGALALSGLGNPAALAADSSTPTLLWSAQQKPFIYGTESASLHVGDAYSDKDAAFRVYSRDIEDGDLTASLVEKGAHVPVDKNGKIDASAAGKSYTYEYTSRDSDGNTATFTKIISVQPKDSHDNRTIAKVIYNNASAWNTQLQGINRTDYHDKQVMGLTIPANKTVNASVIAGDTKLSFSLPTNDSKTDGANVQIENKKSGVITGPSSTSAPLIVQTPMNSKAEGSKVKNITVLLSYGDGITLTPYFYQGDDEKAFDTQWDAAAAQNNQYAFIEGKRSLTLAHHDIDKQYLTTKLFTTLDEALKYHDDIQQRYDELIGLQARPSDPLDQQIRSKAFFRANIHGAGGAYYAGNHIGVHRDAVWPLYDKGWGLLHELGHGYQGSLGRNNGAFQGGETYNNILAYYVQHNPNILDVQKIHYGYWYDRVTQEPKVNAQRLAGTDPGYNKLMNAFINMLDGLGQSPTQAASTKNAAGREPMAALNHWYRTYVASGHSTTNESAWLLAFADARKANLLPYLDAWGYSVPESTRIALGERPDLDNMVILQDALGVNADGSAVDPDLTEKVMKDANVKGRFSLVFTSQLKNYLAKEKKDLKGSVTVKLNGVNAADVSKLNGKTVYFTNKGQTIGSATVQNGTATATLPVGAYSVQAPYLDGYTYPVVQTVTVTPSTGATHGQATNTFTYVKGTGLVFSNSFQLLGRWWKTLSAQGSLNATKNQLDITFGTSDSGCGSQTPKDDKSVCASITVKNASGTVKKTSDNQSAQWVIKNGQSQFTSDGKPASHSVPIALGDTVTVHWFLWNSQANTKFLDADGKDQSFNHMASQEETYRVTALGLVRVDPSQTTSETTALTTQLEQKLNNAQKTFNGAHLSDARYEVNRRAEILNWYNQLPQSEQSKYATFITQVRGK